MDVSACSPVWAARFAGGLSVTAGTASIPSPQARGTGGTLIALWMERGDRGRAPFVVPTRFVVGWEENKWTGHPPGRMIPVINFPRFLRVPAMAAANDSKTPLD